MMNRVILTMTEIEALAAFAKDHVHGGPLVGEPDRWGIIAIETFSGSIGETVLAACTHCGVEKDITDYSTW